MKVLITGATGFLGSVLVRRVLAAGDQSVRVLVRAGSATAALDAASADAPQALIERHAGSLDTLADALAAVQGVDLVYHLAAAKRGSAAEVLRGTLATSRNLLDAVRRQPVPPRVVLVSSFGVHATAGLDAHALVDEATALEPSPGRRDVYSHAKLEQERMFRDAHVRHGIGLVVIRPGVIYGEGHCAPSNRVGFGPRFGLFFLFGGDNPLPLTHVENCAEALRFAATHARFDGDTYDVVDEDPPGCRDYLHRYRAVHPGFAIIGVPFRIVCLLAAWVAWLHRVTRGRVPAWLTPYRARATWKPLRYSGAALRVLGFRQPVASAEALTRVFGEDRKRK